MIVELRMLKSSLIFLVEPTNMVINLAGIPVDSKYLFGATSFSANIF